MSHDYDKLSPDLILDAVESVGLYPSGHVLTLNSYENRVFQIGIDDGDGIVAKFYRPERWTDASILEEHSFTQTLADAEIPIVAPWQSETKQTLFSYQGFRFSIFPRRGGRTPELENLDNLEWIGRFIGRIHLVGQSEEFKERPSLTPQTFGWDARQAVLDSPFLPLELQTEYKAITSTLITQIKTIFSEISPNMIRLHGDCHPGNILWTENGPHFVDMDDCRSAPAIQDLWMLLSGSRREMTEQLDALLEGYRTFCDFDTRQTALIEPLRTLRQIYYTAWLCQRWNDPAFPLAFPWFEEHSYWQSHISDLQQQLLLIAEPPISIY